MVKTFWISFCDSKTGASLGICVIDVTRQQADEAVEILKRVNPDGKKPGDEWTIAAIGQTLRAGCNPGGEVAVTEVRDVSVLPANLPKNTLIEEKELKASGWA